MSSMVSVLLVISLLSFVGSGATIPQPAAASRVAQTDQVMAELIAAELPGRQGRELWIGVHFRLAKGWHIYWKNPGDSGSAPTVSWTVAPETPVEPLRWPTPARLPLGPLMNYGYEDEVVLPARMLSAQNSHPALTLSANLHWVVCSTECVPGRAQLALTIPASASARGLAPDWADLIAKWRSRVPVPMPVGWHARATFRTHTFTLSVTLNRAATHAVFFPVDESQIDDSAPQAVDARATELRIRLQQSSQMARPPKRLRGVLVLDSNASFMIDTAVTPDRSLPQSHRRSE